MWTSCSPTGWPAPRSPGPDTPLQRALQAALEDLAAEKVAAVTVDGCGAPQLGVSLAGLARAMRRIAAAAPGTAEHRVAEAMRAHPYLLGGTGRDVTRLISAVPGLVAKDGAEGVYVAAVPDGRTVAVKVEDGAARARMPVLVAALRRLGVEARGRDGLDALTDVADVAVLGGGRRVGALRVLPLGGGGQVE